MCIEVNKDLYKFNFDKFWYCSLIKGLEYLRLKVILFNFYPNSWHCIFWRFIYHHGETSAFVEKKSNFRGAPSQENIFECAWYFRWGTHLYISLFPSVRPSVRLSVLPSVTHHILGTVHHMIFIFGRHV